jgi:hypothetical protein
MFNFFKRLFEPREVSIRRREGMKWLRSLDSHIAPGCFLCRFCQEKTFLIQSKPIRRSPITGEVFQHEIDYHTLATFCPRCQVLSASNFSSDDYMKYQDWDGEEDLFEKKMSKLRTEKPKQPVIIRNEDGN